METKDLKFLENQEFIDKFLAAESAEEVQTLFREQGVELSLEDVEKIGQEIREAYRSQMGEGELSDDAMEQVAGGGLGGWLLKTVGKKVTKLIVKDVWDNVVKPGVKKVVYNVVNKVTGEPNKIKA